ncbi:exosortase C-terminal domain/associated protein EpsI [uncultured Sphingobium sp.]|uniref:exosortase C-terminal domain/associated protein EpsI n=1 Tax=uncultured Sphingobium sp. TaxID=316087 RepID=UPI0026227713|nr:exosortase C-terminal domain/associated protein EpsI [uncultured Sphingobium sp.]
MLLGETTGKTRFDGADHFVTARYRNARGQVVDIAIATYARQAEGRELVGFAQGAADPDSEWVWSSPARAPAGALGEQITAPGPVVRHVVSAYAVGGGAPTGSKPAVKLATLKARLLGGDQRAVAILVSAEQTETQDADAAVTAFLDNLGDMRLLADRAIGIR